MPLWAHKVEKVATYSVATFFASMPWKIHFAPGIPT